MPELHCYSGILPFSHTADLTEQHRAWTVTNPLGIQVGSKKIKKNALMPTSYCCCKLAMPFRVYLKRKKPATLHDLQQNVMQQPDRCATVDKPVRLMTRSEFNEANRLLSEFNIAPMPEIAGKIVEEPIYDFLPPPRIVAIIYDVPPPPRPVAVQQKQDR
ncbi:hypothetical protein J2125_001104 [Erwinia toletana]|uniref:Uncharacterized protein n=1 Tax=Winslowiella toletana TaxID=92490 RepID=A0ABS4P5J1_9GAMM|nr:hypothetical protein [Winslowiella toletana]